MSRYPPAQPAASNLASLKMQQIEGMRQLHPGVREVERNTIYEIPIYINSRPVSFRIMLPPTFPGAPPQISIVPMLRHRFLDKGVVISDVHHSLHNWGPQIHLGKLLQDIISKFTEEPPTDGGPSSNSPYPPSSSYPNPSPPYPNTTPAYHPYPSSTYPSTTNPNPPPYPSSYPYPNNAPPSTAPPPYPQPPTQNYGTTAPNMTAKPTYPAPAVAARPPPPSTPLPPTPKPIPTVESLHINWNSKSVEELSDLLQDETKFEQFFRQIPFVQEEDKTIKSTRESNEKIADHSKSLAAEIDGLSQQFAANQAKLAEAQKALELALQSQATIQQQFAPAVLGNKLAEAAKKTDRESEDLAAQFSSGSLTTADMIKQYRELRTLYHMRSVKREFLTRRT
ncbi:vacuolar protein sorting-associated protein 37A [Pelomyxa schiedti]|nr:vacuolar protein sorting-associated protein 37A [Pelomyxa schiedti]